MATPNDTTPTKTCTKCGKELPATAEYFARHRARKDGLCSRCKSCANEAKRQWRLDNLKRNRDYSRQWRIDNRERYNALNRRWIAKNPDKKRAVNNRSSAKHREAIRARSRDRYWENHEDELERKKRVYRKYSKQWRTQYRRWRSRKNNAKGNHTSEDIDQIYTTQHGMCAYCGIRLHGKYHVDHVVPLSRGGSNSPDNLAITCAFCNKSKGAKLVQEWTEVRGW